jgi:hypothetical protein
MSRLLLIYCPINPRTLNPSGGGDIDFNSPGESFRWCLVENGGRINNSGTGSVSSLPFADEALILVPTVDVRLIHTRLPLISGKKLDSLLPTLAEPFLIDQRTPLRYQALPPQPGASGVERTIVVTSASWMSWLETQLADLPVRSIRMIPDCLLLPEPEAESSTRTTLSNPIDHLMVMAVREGYDWGSGWIEAIDTKITDTRAFEWSWVVPQATPWIAHKNGINLLLQAPPKPKTQRTRHKIRWQPQVEWFLWRRPLRFAAYTGAIYLSGSILYLATLGLSNWRWSSATEESARLNLLNPVSANSSVLPAYIQQATQKIHASGKDTGGDFIPMAASLQTLLSAYPEGLLENLAYQPDGIRFRLRNMNGTPDADKLQHRARTLDMALVALGRNEYQLLPYAGVHAGSMQDEARP